MSREENPAPATDVGALVARLRKTAGMYGNTHMAPYDLYALAATALQAESDRADRWQASAEAAMKALAEEDDEARAAEARADREKARADEAERLHKHDRQMWDATRRRAEIAEAALTACRQDTAKLIAEAVAAEREKVAELELKARGADAVIAAIERAIPDWRSYRDLVDAIECKLAGARS